MLRLINRNLERWALIFFYTLLVVTMIIEVFRREMFAYSSIWGEEIVRYAFIYLVWIGAASAVRDRIHLRIDVIFSYLSNRLQTLLYMFGDLVMLVVAIISFFMAWETLEVSMKFTSVSHGLRISMVWFLFAVPFGLGLLLLRIVQSFWRDLKILKNGEPAYKGPTLFEGG